MNAAKSGGRPTTEPVAPAAEATETTTDPTLDDAAAAFDGTGDPAHA